MISKGICAVETHFLFIKRFFSFLLDQKRNKKIKPQYFYPKNHRTHFPIVTPAARVSHSTRGPLPSANAEILTVIFNYKNIRASRASCCDYYFYLETIFFVLITHKLIIYWSSWIFDFKRNKRSSLNIFIQKIIGRISLSWPQPLAFRT